MSILPVTLILKIKVQLHRLLVVHSDDTSQTRSWKSSTWWKEIVIARHSCRIKKANSLQLQAFLCHPRTLRSQPGRFHERTEQTRDLPARERVPKAHDNNHFMAIKSFTHLTWKLVDLFFILTVRGCRKGWMNDEYTGCSGIHETRGHTKNPAGTSSQPLVELWSQFVLLRTWRCPRAVVCCSLCSRSISLWAASWPSTHDTRVSDTMRSASCRPRSTFVFPLWCTLRILLAHHFEKNKLLQKCLFLK